MDLGKIISEFPAQLLYAALIALIFSGTGRIWSQITHQKASATAGMQMGQVMGGLSPAAPARPASSSASGRRVTASIMGVCCCISAYSNSPSTWLALLLAFCWALYFLWQDSLPSRIVRRRCSPWSLLVFGTLALIIGFLIIGLRVERSIRLLHMTYVALGLAATTIIINWLAGALRPTSVAVVIGAIIFALIQTFFGMGIGGGLSFLIGGRQDPDSRADGPAIPLWRPAERPALSATAWPQPYPPQYPPTTLAALSTTTGRPQ